MSSNEECKLNSQRDWERWNRQFQSSAVAADLWDLIKGQENPIQKPIEPNINSFPRSTTAQTRSQSQANNQAAEESPSTVQQEDPIDFLDLSANGQKAFTAATTIYENRLRAYNNQRLGIQKLIDLINRTVSPSYLQSCCKPLDKINTWYINLEKMAGTSTIQDYTHAKERYHKALRPLTKIKDYEKWITEWELAIHNAKDKNVANAMRPVDWIEDLFSAVGQVLPEWVNAYRLVSEDKVEAGTLIFRDTAKAMRTAATHQARAKSTRIAKGAFGSSFAGEEAETLQQRDALEPEKEEPAEKRKRRRRKSTKGANEPPAGRSQSTARRECSTPPDQENQSSPPSKRRKCQGCGGLHSYRKCFYLFPTLAPEYWVPRAETTKMAKKALEEDEDFAEEIRKLRLAEEKKRKND
jgi:hypothetical protein